MHLPFSEIRSGFTFLCRYIDSSLGTNVGFRCRAVHVFEKMSLGSVAKYKLVYLPQHGGVMFMFKHGTVFICLNM